MDDTLPPVIEHRDGPICWITLNRPERMNAVTPELYDALGEAVARAAEDAAVLAVVLTGAGRAFCAGRDLKAPAAHPVATPGDWVEQRVEYLRRHARIAFLLHDMPKPTIAMINGSCAGAGLSLAGACDLRVAAEGAVLTSAFVKAGLPGDMGGTWFWSRILGAGKARRLYLMSERFDAVAAERFGLVDRVVPGEILQATVSELAANLAAMSPRALRHAKALLNAAEDGHFEMILDMEATAMAIVGIDAALAGGEISAL